MCATIPSFIWFWSGRNQCLCASTGQLSYISSLCLFTEPSASGTLHSLLNSIGPVEGIWGFVLFFCLFVLVFGLLLHFNAFNCCFQSSVLKGFTEANQACNTSKKWRALNIHNPLFGHSICLCTLLWDSTVRSSRKIRDFGAGSAGGPWARSPSPSASVFFFCKEKATVRDWGLKSI